MGVSLEQVTDGILDLVEARKKGLISEAEFLSLRRTLLRHMGQ